MKTLFLMSLLVGTQALAAYEPLLLRCIPSQPCVHAASMGKCIYGFEVSGRNHQEGTERIYHARPSGELMMLPPRLETVSISSDSGLIRFQDETGDQWGQLREAGGDLYSGQITVDQDFEFEVSCRNEAIGFE